MPIEFNAIQLGHRYERTTLASLWGYQSYEAISRGVVTQTRNPNIVLFVTRIKQHSLTNYKDYISGDLLYWEGEEGHGSDDLIASALENGRAIHLFYREIHHTPFEYRGTVQLLDFHPRSDKPSEFLFTLCHDRTPSDDFESYATSLDTVQDTERNAIVRARIGQGMFRRALLDEWEGCSVTGVFVPSILRASHIKPWRECSNRERIDVANGLLLLPQYDELFDNGLISFSDLGSLLISKVLKGISRELLGITKNARLRHVRDAHKPYLDYHRSDIFVG